MKRSTDRILTTHAGSLPRPSDLSEMLRAKEAGQPYDAQALQQRLARAVVAVVQQQVENGIDIITDGEQSKTSFTTYLSERLAGIETRPGAVARAVSDRQRQDFPEYFAAQRAATPGGGRRQFYCVGPLAVYRPGSGTDGHPQPAGGTGGRPGRGGVHPGGRCGHRRALDCQCVLSQ